MLIIENDGQNINQTNYWDSEQARKGYCFLSWNAGAARVLLPDNMASEVKEMRSAEYVIISRGAWTNFGGRDAIELMFEDGSDNPYCLHLVSEQADRMIPDTDQGGGFVIAVWTRKGKEFQLPGKYRVVREIPCLERWNEQ